MGCMQIVVNSHATELKNTDIDGFQHVLEKEYMQINVNLHVSEVEYVQTNAKSHVSERKNVNIDEFRHLGELSKIQISLSSSEGVTWCFSEGVTPSDILTNEITRQILN
jgi:hypothetical protein